METDPKSTVPCRTVLVEMRHYYYPFVLCCTDTGQIVNIVLFSGPYNLCLPVVCCPVCEYKWTPGISDLLGCRYWPATTSCQLLFKFDVFTSFEEMKLASPALSQQAFLRMLEHRSLSTGRVRPLFFFPSFFYIPNQSLVLTRILPSLSPDG